MTPRDQAASLWRDHFPEHPQPAVKLRVDGGALLHDGVRIVRVSPPPHTRRGHQLVEVVVIEGAVERQIFRNGSWSAR